LRTKLKSNEGLLTCPKKLSLFTQDHNGWLSPPAKPSAMAGALASDLVEASKVYFRHKVEAGFKATQSNCGWIQE
jgi:hypothetical protein